MKIFNRFRIRKLIEDYYGNASDEAAEALVDLGKPAAKRLIQDFTHRGYHGKSGDYTQKRFTKILVNIGEQAVESLIEAEAFQTGFFFVDEAIAETFGEVGDKRLVEPLIRRLKDGNEYSDSRHHKEADVLRQVQWALAKIGEPAIEPLIQVLKDGKNDAREYAARALGTIGDERAVEPLIQALEDEDEDARREAIEALGKIGDERAVEPLIQALKGEDKYIQWIAIVVLGTIGDERAVEPLIQVLKDGKNDARKYAARALGKIGDKRAVEPLIQALSGGDKDTQQNAIEALGKIGGERAVESLICVLETNEDEDVQDIVQCALVEIGDECAEQNS